MANIIDYVKRVGRQAFQDRKLSLLDMAVLNELAYLPLGELANREEQGNQVQLIRDLFQGDWKAESKLAPGFMVTPERMALLEAVLASPRYEDLQFSHYVNDISGEFEKQFAAMILSIPSIGHTQLVFRGTDDSLIGWKEDLNMTYMSEIPAQRSAKAYLTDFLETFDGRVILSGHSKGGNLALFASIYQPSALQDKLERIYVFDAPGLHQQHLERLGYEAIKTRIRAFQPEEAIVGVMLTSDLDPRIVASNQKGLLQHEMLSWQVEEIGFRLLEKGSDFSVALEKTFSEWMATYSKQELKLMVDSFFDLFFQSGLTSLDDLASVDRQVLQRFFGQLSDLDREKRQLIFQSFTKMLEIYRKNDFELKKAHLEARFQDWYQDSFLEQMKISLFKDKKEDKI